MPSGEVSTVHREIAWRANVGPGINSTSIVQTAATAAVERSEALDALRAALSDRGSETGSLPRGFANALQHPHPQEGGRAHTQLARLAPQDVPLLGRHADWHHLIQRLLYLELDLFSPFPHAAARLDTLDLPPLPLLGRHHLVGYCRCSHLRR